MQETALRKTMLPRVVSASSLPLPMGEVVERSETGEGKFQTERSVLYDAVPRRRGSLCPAALCPAADAKAKARDDICCFVPLRVSAASAVCAHSWRDLPRILHAPKAPLCKGGSADRRWGIVRLLLLQMPQLTIPPSFAFGKIHLPLHKGGLIARRAATER